MECPIKEIVRPQILSKRTIKYPQVGETLSNGYTVMANYSNQCVLAYNRNAPEPYVVWDLDRNGDTVNGRYRAGLESTQKEFAESCFSWFCEPWAKEQISQAFEKIAEQFFEKYGVPKTIQIDKGAPDTE